MSEFRNQLEVAEGKLVGLQGQLVKLERLVAVEEERVLLLRRLLDLEKPKTGQLDVQDNRNMSVLEVPARKPPTKGHARLEDVVVSILSRFDQAVHIGEIRTKLLEHGIRIPGKGTDSNIIARIIKEPRIERESGRRGYYRLKQG
jgi:hypothetical protein